MNARLMDEGPAAGNRVAFLVGAGRSGTTLLYKLLCLHPGVAYISNYENRLPWFPHGLAARALARGTGTRLHAWFNARGNAYFIRRPWVQKAFPTPHEGESVYADCGVPLNPAPDERPTAATTQRLRRRFETLRKRSGAQLFLTKRTANNRRIRYLDEVFPQARYVHLVRDGREVTQSLASVDWWNGHKVWWDGRTPPEIERAGQPRLAVCARNWVREMEQLSAQLAAIPAQRVLELRFERLLQDPLVELSRAVSFLGLPFTDEYRQAIDALSLHPVRPRWGSEWNADELDCVLHETRPMLRQFGYPV